MLQSLTLLLSYRTTMTEISETANTILPEAATTAIEETPNVAYGIIERAKQRY